MKQVLTPDRNTASSPSGNLIPRHETPTNIALKKMGSSSESSKSPSASSDEENGVSDLENQSNIQSRNIDESQSEEEESGDDDAEGSEGVTTRNGKKRKRQEADDDDDNDEEKVVFSHAEKRRQKKKRIKDVLPKPQSKSATELTSSGRQNSVWVGNLSYKTTVDELKTFFARAGEMTRIHMPTHRAAGAGPGRKAENRGFAYVDFASPEAKACAIALSEQPLIGRKLLIKDGDDFTGRPDVNATGTGTGTSIKTCSKTAQKILRAQKQPPGPTLFLGNLGFETTEADILEMLNAHRMPSEGRQQKTDHLAASAPSSSWIRKVRMGTFEDSGLCKGFAFVDFMSMEDATSALTHPKNSLLNGRKLVIEYASPDAVRRGAPKGPGKAPRLKPLPTDGKPLKTARLEHPSKRQRVDEAKTFKKGPTRRMKPGASLASAQRESVVIIPSQGKKIKFD
ncbi:hypothetical protein APHAL10511_001602 [Amanita phalloides]|nr:hypothetical protein APHAL10511_001602 [Amanita phalloides]